MRNMLTEAAPRK